MTTKVYVKKNGEAVIPADTLKAWGIKPFSEIEIDIRTATDGKQFPPDIAPNKTVQDFLDEFEEKYGMSSGEFYEKWQRGETEDIPEVNEWAGYCKTKQLLERDGLDPAKTTYKLYKKIEFVRES
jgi:bifunctional DNA-binding transcriptional regulator/antitoxin component of YhaV-PrlF toxin-antitoxin module